MKLKRSTAILLTICITASQIFPVLASNAVVTRLMPNVSKTEDQEIIDMTLDEAVALAIKKSNDLKKLNENIDLTKSDIDNYGSSMSVRSDSETTAVVDSSYLSSYVSYMQNIISYSISKMNVELMEKSVEHSVLSLFVTIDNAEKALQLYDKSLALQEKDLEITKVKYELGLVSQIAYKEAQTAYEKSLKNRSDQEESIKDAYTSLNSLLGYSSNTRYNLTTDKDMSYEPMAELDIDYYTNLKVADNLNIISAEKELELAEIRKRTISASGGDSYDQLVVNVNQASRAVGDAKDSLKDKLTNCQNQIQSIQRSVETNELELEQLYDQLEVKLVQFELGQITELAIENAQYSIEVLEETIRTQKLNHYLLKMQLEEPNLL